MATRATRREDRKENDLGTDTKLQKEIEDLKSLVMEQKLAADSLSEARHGQQEEQIKELVRQLKRQEDYFDRSIHLNIHGGE